MKPSPIKHTRNICELKLFIIQKKSKYAQGCLLGRGQGPYLILPWVALFLHCSLALHVVFPVSSRSVHTQRLFDYLPVTLEETINAIYSGKPNGASGVDGIPSLFWGKGKMFLALIIP